MVTIIVIRVLVLVLVVAVVAVVVVVVLPESLHHFKDYPTKRMSFCFKRPPSGHAKKKDKISTTHRLPPILDSTVNYKCPTKKQKEYLFNGCFWFP